MKAVKLIPFDDICRKLARHPYGVLVGIEKHGAKQLPCTVFTSKDYIKFTPTNGLSFYIHPIIPNDITCNKEDAEFGGKVVVGEDHITMISHDARLNKFYVEVRLLGPVSTDCLGL
jgi:hypothetical protein